MGKHKKKTSKSQTHYTKFFSELAKKSTSLATTKGTEIQLCPATLHKLKSVWGEDAEEFKPERWMDPSSFSEEDQQSINFVTPDMMWAYMPFLTGPRSSIGSKLALIEIKVMLYYLLIDLEYASVPGFTFKKSARITMRPFPGMNLIIKRFEHDTPPPQSTSANPKIAHKPLVTV